MSIKSVLSSLKILANDNGLSEPFVVGGIPRDKILNRSKKIEDVDITSGDDSIHKLAELAANFFKVTPMKLPDGHIQMYINGIKYDFSTNFKSPDVLYFLKRAGLSDPTELQQEIFSRDFTVNTFISPMGLRKIIDPTGMGVEDIKNKLLRTPLPSRITLRDDPKRVVRAIYLASKLGFKIEKDIINWAVNNKERIKKSVSGGFSRRKLASAFRHDPDKTIYYLSKMDLWNVVSIPRIIEEEIYIRKRMP